MNPKTTQVKLFSFTLLANCISLALTSNTTLASFKRPPLSLEAYPVFSPAQLFQLEHEETSYSQFVRARLRTREEAFRRTSPTVLNLIVIGAGPFNAIYVANRGLSGGEAVILEATSHLGKFDELGGTFRLNSQETLESSGTLFAGSPIQIRQHNLNRQVYPDSQALAYTTLDALDFSGVPVLLNEKVERIDFEPAPGSWLAAYRVQTSSGLTLYTAEISVGTGLGTPKISPLPTAESNAAPGLKNNEDETTAGLRPDVFSTRVPQLIHSDDFLASIKKKREANLNPLADYSGKSIAVIGGAHGAMTALLALLGNIGKETFSQANPPKEIHWIGYRFIDNRSLYSPLYQNDLIHIYPNSRALAVEKTLTGSLRVKIAYPGKTELESIEVDQVITGTGYKDSFPRFFYIPTESDFSISPLFGYLPEKSGLTDQKVQIGQQISRDGKGDSIFLVGGCALSTYPQILEEEVGGNLGTLIEVLGIRTAALAMSLNHQSRVLVQIQEDPSFHFIAAQGEAQTDGSHGPYHRQMEFRKAMGRILNQVETLPNEKALKLQFRKSQKGIEVRSELNPKTGIALDSLLPLLNEELLAIREILKFNQSVELSVPLSYGRAQLHFLQIMYF